MILAAELLGAFAAGAAAATATIVVYARRLWRRAQGQLAGQLLGLGVTGQEAPPPFRSELGDKGL